VSGHRLVVVLGLAACAVLAGARSFTAIVEWAANVRDSDFDGGRPVLIGETDRHGPADRLTGD